MCAFADEGNTITGYSIHWFLLQKRKSRQEMSLTAVNEIVWGWFTPG